MKKIFLFILIIQLKSYSCSNILVSTIDKKYNIVARSMDFEFNLGHNFGFGAKNEENISDTNLDEKADPVKWKNLYNFIGQVGFDTGKLTDGINEEGLYVGLLYLPDITEYPNYDIESKKPALAILDSANYLLGNAKSTKDAIEKIKEVQIINSGIANKNGKILSFPLHISIRDSKGDSAVIEFLKGGIKIYNPAGNVLTNSPEYRWQINNLNKYIYLKTNNTFETWDGLTMNGSGMVGLPGDWTPPSRFVRGSKLLQFAPAVKDLKDAITTALSTIQSIEVPLNTNPAPTLWTSLSNLNDKIYYYKKIYTIENIGGKKIYKSVLDFEKPWEKLDIKEISKNSQKQKNFIKAKIIPLDKKFNKKEIIKYKAEKTTYAIDS